MVDPVTGFDAAAFAAAMPKAELHLHLEGAIFPEPRLRLAARNGITLEPAARGWWEPAPRTAQDPGQAAADNLASFLAAYEGGQRVLVGVDDFREAMVEVLHRCAAANVRHAEIFFDPQAHTGRGISLATVLTGLTAGIDACADLDVHAELIMSFHRHRPAEDALGLLDEAEPFRDRIIGLGLDDYEGGDWVTRFTPVYAVGRERGYRLTAHCDVDQPLAARNMLRCLDELGVERIDHGLNAADDPQLLRRIVDGKIACTACPTWSGAAATIKPQEVRRILDLHEAGVRIGLNSDDPGLFSSGMLDSIWAAFATAADLDRATILALGRNSFDSAWLPDSERDRHLADLERFSRSWPS